MPKSSSELDFVAIALDAPSKDALVKLVDQNRIKFIETADEFETFIDSFSMDAEATIFVGNALNELAPIELGQSLRASFINTHIVFLTFDANSFSVSELKKNGYSKALLLPMDLLFFEELVVSSARGGIRKRFKAVKMVDIDPGEPLNFSVYFYMSANKKYALLTAGGSLSEKKYEMLKSRSETTVFVEMDQVEKFYEYSAEKIARLSSTGTDVVNGSETERSERLKQNIQALFHNILDQKAESNFDSGRDLMEQSHQVVQKFVEIKTKVNLKRQIEDVLGADGDSYSHAQAVSSLACLLSMAIGVGVPEELAIAGLFHDIGIAGFSTSPNPINMAELSAEDLERYTAHPQASINMLKSKKFVLTPSVSEIIEKHHERVDGQGFPAKLPSHKIPMAAQLLAFSDWFEYLSQPKPGQPKLTPLQVVAEIQASAGLSIELTLKIKNFFLSLEPADKPLEVEAAS